MLPDAEAITGTYLRADAAVAALVGSRVMGDTPRDTSTAWVRLTQIDGAPIATSRAHHVATAWVQVDCYAGDSATGGHQEASVLARTVQQSLSSMNAATHTGAVVAGVKIAGTHRQPDLDFQPARERFLFTAEITLHAA